MPIIAGVFVEPPVEEPPPPTAIPEVGYASVTYYDPHGVAWPMTDRSRTSFALADDITGLGAAPAEMTLDAHPRGGARIRHIQPQPRAISWPVRVQAGTHQQFIDAWRALGRAFTDTRRLGPGVLEFARPDGRRRRIRVHYDSGWEGLGQFGSGVNWDNMLVELFAEDPYWYDPRAIGVHREHSTGAPYLAPYPTVSSSRVLGATTIANPGDVEVWPVWVITGPASLVTFTRTDATTGAVEEFILDPNDASIAHGNLLTGEQVTVTTETMRVRYQDGANWSGALNHPDAVLWALQPGDNAVSFQLSGSGPGSAVDMSFFPRYEMA